MSVITKETFIIETISKECVEQGNFEAVEIIIKYLKTLGTNAEGSLAITFDEYNDVREEVFEIPEIRAWSKTLVERYPYIFYFLTELDDNIHMIAANIGDVKMITTGDKLSPLEYASLGISREQVPKALLRITIPKEMSMKIINGVVGYCATLGVNPAEINNLLAIMPWLCL